MCEKFVMMQLGVYDTAGAVGRKREAPSRTAVDSGYHVHLVTNANDDDVKICRNAHRIVHRRVASNVKELALTKE